jgi:hypothetical protein
MPLASLFINALQTCVTVCGCTTPLGSLFIFAGVIVFCSLMNEKPYHNEPGFEVARRPRDVENYNDCIG